MVLVWSKSVSSTKLHPTNLVLAADIGAVRETPKSRDFIILRRGVLIRVQIVGLAPLPCPDPCTGLLSMSLFPYEREEMPWEVLMKCFICWRVVSMQTIGSKGIPTRCIARDATE